VILEESIDRGTEWADFEPNGPPLLFNRFEYETQGCSSSGAALPPDSTDSNTNADELAGSGIIG
jgi:hypothetical protein